LAVDEENLQMWKIIVNILNRLSQTASSLRLRWRSQLLSVSCYKMSLKTLGLWTLVSMVMTFWVPLRQGISWSADWPPAFTKTLLQEVLVKAWNGSYMQRHFPKNKLQLCPSNWISTNSSNASNLHLSGK
jgi:hypothetical protein